MKYANEYQIDIDAVNREVDSLYESKFAQYFKIVSSLYQRFQSAIHPITDEELESILTLVPLDLFAVSEELNKFRLCLEVIKLRNKEKKEEFIQNRTAEISCQEMSATVVKEYVTKHTALDMIEYEILASIYSCVIDMVSSRIQFSKELIMSAKKIWDGRRHTENSMPVSEGAVKSEEPLPVYKPLANSRDYIK